ncbi:MAG: aminotransferase class V-fold PLP-dependent enzyme [Alphaproteobacteria bacterium]|nr:aminotransferase class V-fold PLP-dependent enzyme [Alphaproteobacteria bacterium]
MKEIIYMDAAASWQKPQSLIDAEVDFLKNFYANSGRGICERAGFVDSLIEKSRLVVADFIKSKPDQIIFTSGTTDSMNRVVGLIQNSYTNMLTVAVSDIDHHSARMPWENQQRLKKCNIVKSELDTDNNIDINLIPKADVFVITAMSNVLGIAQDVRKIIKKAKEQNPDVITIVDAAQYIVHNSIDVKSFDCDFLCFSGHKIGSDTGVGILYIKQPDRWYPDKFGGGMINKIQNGKDWILNNSPNKYEAGTLPLTQIIGLPYAIKYCEDWNKGEELIRYMNSSLSETTSSKSSGADASQARTRSASKAPRLYVGRQTDKVTAMASISFRA